MEGGGDDDENGNAIQCNKCRRHFKTKAILTQHQQRTGCADQRHPSKRKVTETLTKLVMRRDHVSDVVSGLTCAYSKFVMAKNMGTYQEKCYPLLFSIDEFKNIQRNPTAWKDIRDILNDGRSHGTYNISIDKFFGKS